MNAYNSKEKNKTIKNTIYLTLLSAYAALGIAALAKEAHDNFSEYQEYKNTNSNKDEHVSAVTFEVKDEIYGYGYFNKDNGYIFTYDGVNEQVKVEKHDFFEIIDFKDNFSVVRCENGKKYYINNNDLTILPLNKNVCVIDQSDRKLTLYKHESKEKILEDIVVLGKESTPTPEGRFNIETKEQNRYLFNKNKKYWVEYCMFIDLINEIALHDAEIKDYGQKYNTPSNPGWRDPREFTTDAYNIRGSHGCINLSRETARILYEEMEIGDIVLVKK